ncbi:MAG: YHYH protein [Cyanobacteria bacterium P01_F01_bin.116]
MKRLLKATFLMAAVVIMLGCLKNLGMVRQLAIATPKTNATSQPKVFTDESVCHRVTGSYAHTGQDVLGSRNLNGSVSIEVRDGRCVITANGIPDHAFNNGSQPFRHDVSAQSSELSFPLHPTRASTPTELSLRTNNGVLLNGARIDMLAAACFGVGDEKTGCNDPNQPWRFDPVYQANGFRMDRYLAHTQPDGSYHYHGVVDLPSESMVIGFAADGFPIRTPYVWDAGRLRQVQSSYRLKVGPRIGSGGPFPGGSYDGTFRDDWEYVQGLGDLDVCNGADFGEGYAYYATERFPYYVGCFVGTPDRSFNKQGGSQPSGNEIKPVGERGRNERPQRPRRPDAPM